MKGAHYRSEFLYSALALLKLGKEYDLRFKIAARYIGPEESVIDVCSGPGDLRNFIPGDCTYTAMDASLEFLSLLKKKNVETIVCDLNAGWPPSVPGSDVITMVIALSQFRNTTADILLESFKEAAKRVVIVEDVLPRPQKEGSLIQRAMNYLCGTDYYVPVSSWYTCSEFQRLMRDHGYQCETVSSRYMVGLYGF
ncbi:MAG: class I SAM-dependent methyltransferase [Candidatus Omnitrophota bacterium]